MLVGLNAHSGAPMWHHAFDATEWAVITSLAVDGSHIVVGGTFSGTLRVDSAVVSSAGQTDGFVARVDANGALAWLRRMGGPGADTISAVAARTDVIAIAGTVAAGAEFAGQPVEPHALSPYGDGFVVALRSNADYMWSQTFGGPGDDVVSGVAIDARHHIAVATTIDDTTRIGTRTVSPRGASAGVVAFVSPHGQWGPFAVVDATGSVRLRSIAAVDRRIVVSGVFAGTMAPGGTATGIGAMTAIGDDDAFVASLAPTGHVDAAWHLAGTGREEVVSLNEVPGGFLAGVAYSGDLTVGADHLPSPGSPASGAAIVVHGGS